MAYSLVLMVLSSSFSHSASVLPPKGFFVDSLGNPNVLIVAGKQSSAQDIILASSLARRIGEMAGMSKEEVEEINFETDLLSATSNVEFDYSNYHTLFDVTKNPQLADYYNGRIWYFDWRLENLRNTLPSGFIATEGRAWSSRVASVDVFDDYFPVIEYLEENGYYKIFSGLPRVYENQAFYLGESRRFGRYTVKLLEIDMDAKKAVVEVTFPDKRKEKIILPQYCHDCKAVLSELFTSSSGALNASAIAALDTLKVMHGKNLVELKYFTNPADPLYPQRPSCACTLDEVQNRKNRFNIYYEPDISEPDNFFDARWRVPNTSSNFLLDYDINFTRSNGLRSPVRIYTTGYIEEHRGQINAYVTSDLTFDSLRIYYVLFEKEVDLGGTTYRNVVRGIITPDSLSTLKGASAEFSHDFYMVTDPLDPHYCLANNFPSVADYRNLGIAVFVEGIFHNSRLGRDEMAVLQSTVLDLEEKDAYVFENDVDADGDGHEDEVEFAIENVGVDFLGVAGAAFARLNIYTFDNYRIYDPPACCRGYWTDGTNWWGMEISRQEERFTCTIQETFAIEVNLCAPMEVGLACLGKGDFVYGPKRAIKIVFDKIDPPLLTFKIQYVHFYTKISDRSKTFNLQEIIKLDSEITEEDRKTKNLILIGAQNANSLTRELVLGGASKVDWLKSRGEWEYIQNAFKVGHDVLIIAGADRQKTGFAIRKLTNALLIYTRSVP